MIIVIGIAVVFICVFGGFAIGGGHMGVLVHPNELLIIGGGALGALIIMSPRKVLMDIVKGLMTCLKGVPHNRAAYEDLLKVLYELFMLGRRNGMIALEEHVLDPQNSSIFKKYPGFLQNHHAVEFLCGGLRPIIDGKIKPDQLRLLLDAEINQLENEHHAPVNVLTRTADAMPGLRDCRRRAGHHHHDGFHFRAGGRNWRGSGGGARWHVPRHFAGVWFAGAVGIEPGIYQHGGT